MPAATFGSTSARPIVRDLADKGILAGVALGRLYADAGFENGLIVAVTETTCLEHVATLASALKEALA